eukprot:TRINITY_DN520_c0_g1_i1.p1 TRINITY_DN520_c0_g1~~TRINITY_DN520_c0_g1_i1.p1  ORF type:complete len:218 (+),score=68.09 TRINITY_DN520_c0_g1_i1:326-979(+)
MGCGGSTAQNEEKPKVEEEVKIKMGDSPPEKNDDTFDNNSFESKPGEFNYLFKFLLVGSTSVGKSCLMIRFADDHFSTSYTTTIGVDFKIRTIDIDGIKIKLQIWDTAGQERFQTVTNAYFRGSHGILLVYDITNYDSFTSINKWLEEVDKHAPQNAVKMIVGNKCDMKDQRRVDTHEAKQFAQSKKALFLETSAKDNTNVQEAFNLIAKEIKERIR